MFPMGPPGMPPMPPPMPPFPPYCPPPPPVGPGLAAGMGPLSPFFFPPRMLVAVLRDGGHVLIPEWTWRRNDDETERKLEEKPGWIATIFAVIVLGPIALALAAIRGTVRIAWRLTRWAARKAWTGVRAVARAVMWTARQPGRLVRAIQQLLREHREHQQEIVRLRQSCAMLQQQVAQHEATLHRLVHPYGAHRNE